MILSKFRQKLVQLVHHSTNYFASFTFGFQSCKDLVFMLQNLTFYSTWLTSFSRICIFCNSLYLSVLKLCWKSNVTDTSFRATLISISYISYTFYSSFLSFLFKSKFHYLWINTSSFDFWYNNLPLKHWDVLFLVTWIKIIAIWSMNTTKRGLEADKNPRA